MKSRSNICFCIDGGYSNNNLVAPTASKPPIPLNCHPILLLSIGILPEQTMLITIVVENIMKL